MSVITVERDIAAAPERVWDIITDLERTAEVIRAITALERTDGGGDFRVGTAWRETRVMFGREATEAMAVSALDEGRSYTVESHSRGVLYRSLMRVEPSAGGCRLTWEFGAEPQSISGRLMSLLGRFFEGATRKALQADLDDIAAAAEADAAEAGAAEGATKPDPQPIRSPE
ncbi:MAG: SRPBCC family protein [Candidatus Limnocylindrales bacterium]